MQTRGSGWLLTKQNDFGAAQQSKGDLQLALHSPRQGICLAVPLVLQTYRLHMSTPHMSVMPPR